MEDSAQVIPSLPVIFDTCPNCNSENRLALSLVDSLKAGGSLPKTFPFTGLALQVPLMDQTRPPILVGPTMTLKVMTVMLEICGDCGTVYCTKFDIVDTPAQMQTMKPQNRNTGFPFMKG